MSSANSPPVHAGPFDFQAQRLGPLPIVNHFLGRLGLDAILERAVPTDDPRCELPYAKGLGVLLRSIIVEREPIYRQQETVQAFTAGAFGVDAELAGHLSDDGIGRALDRLFDADRTALLTSAVLATTRKFDLELSRLHNDSTSIQLSGQYREARGRSMRGKRAAWITYGLSKDHRPDLKQLLFILTTSADGGVPVQFRCADGSVSDAVTHVETWDALRKVAGRADFLYVADSKLCTRENMDHIDQKGGRFVTVLPRTRLEDADFRKRLQGEEPAWELIWNRPHPRRKSGPRDRWWAVRDSLPSREAWPVVWVRSSLLALRQERTRREQLLEAEQALKDLKVKLASPKSRLREGIKIEERIAAILKHFSVGSYLKVRKAIREDHRFRQSRRGRPGPGTAYRRITRRRWDIEWETDEAALAYDRKSDGMYPLLTNDRTLTPAQVLEAHKGQPSIEKRFHQCKTVHEIAPVLLKNEGRIEALFFLYFLALLVQALIERELRRAMTREGIAELALYPEERICRRPTTEQVLRLFSLAEHNVLLREGRVVQVFEAKLTALQLETLRLLGVPLSAYRYAS